MSWRIKIDYVTFSEFCLFSTTADPCGTPTVINFFVSFTLEVVPHCFTDIENMGACSFTSSACPEKQKEIRFESRLY